MRWQAPYAKLMLMMAALIGPSVPSVAQVQLTEAQRQELRRQGDANRERNAKEREADQKGFHPTDSVSATATPAAAAISAPVAEKFDRMRPCAIDDFDRRVESYVEAKPEMRPMLKGILQRGTLVVGMPLDMFRMLTCDSAQDLNITTTHAGEQLQYVMAKQNPFMAKYVYARNRTVYAIQQ